MAKLGEGRHRSLPPVKVHPHSEAASITGGYVYHGIRRAGVWRARYIYGDYQSGIIWGLRIQGRDRHLAGASGTHTAAPGAFGENHYGELYLVDHDRTHQLIAWSRTRRPKTTNDFPRRLSQTGLFTFNPRAHQPLAPGVVPYSVNAPLWSDGADGRAVPGVPGDGRIELDNQGVWRLSRRLGSGSNRLDRAWAGSTRPPSAGRNADPSIWKSRRLAAILVLLERLTRTDAELARRTGSAGRLPSM